MKKVLSYTLRVRKNKLIMPKGAKVLSVKTHPITKKHELFVLANVNKDTEERNFSVYCNNSHSTVRSNAKKYVGTFTIENGTDSYHVFED